MSDHRRIEATLSVADDDKSTAREAAGRICAEQIIPYPPDIPVLIPGERITADLLDYLHSGLAAGMQLPDPADPSLGTIRVVSHAAVLA